MQIYLRRATDDGTSSSDLVLIELQGSLAAVEEHGSGGSGGDSIADLRSLPIGNLTLSTTGKPQLMIGSHRLEGQVASLPKPYAVLRKRRLEHKDQQERPSSLMPTTTTTTARLADSDFHDSSTELDRLHRHMAAAPTVEYEVLGVVRERYLFKTRPELIAATSPPSKKLKQSA
ncbi:hypothetical protein RI367_004743 [Sorochytrium milnesiophthora]